MSTEIIISIITLLGTITTVTISNIASSSLIKYRLEELEKKVTLHNNLIERVYGLEKEVAIIEEGLKDDR